MRAPALGVAAALLTLLADQATKLWVLRVHDVRANGPFEIGPPELGPPVRIVEYWNRGVSFGLLQSNEEAARWALVAVAVVASIGFTVWMLRARSRLLGLGLGLVVGGAVGNAIDRVLYGAVFDFVVLRVGPVTWPTIFNVADAAIVVGVLLLLYDSFRPATGEAGLAAAPRKGPEDGPSQA